MCSSSVSGFFFIASRYAVAIIATVVLLAGSDTKTKLKRIALVALMSVIVAYIIGAHIGVGNLRGNFPEDLLPVAAVVGAAGLAAALQLTFWLAIMAANLVRFGASNLLSSAMISVTAETTPIGTWSASLYPTSDEFVHSAVYKDPRITKYLVEWLASSS